MQHVDFLSSWEKNKLHRVAMNQPICVFYIKVLRNRYTLFVNLTQYLLQLSRRPYREDNSHMFHRNVTVLLVNSILLSCLLTFLSSYVLRKYGVVNIGRACSFHFWIYLNTYLLSHFIQYVVYTWVLMPWGAVAGEYWKGTGAPSW